MKNIGISDNYTRASNYKPKTYITSLRRNHSKATRDRDTCLTTSHEYRVSPRYNYDSHNEYYHTKEQNEGNEGDSQNEQSEDPSDSEPVHPYHSIHDIHEVQEVYSIRPYERGSSAKKEHAYK